MLFKDKGFCQLKKTDKKSPLCNVRNTSSIPGWGTKIPHARATKLVMQLLSPYVLEPVCRS